MTKKTIIIGAGGHGKVVLDTLQYHDNIAVVGFLDDSKVGQSILGVSVIGPVQAEHTPESLGATHFIVAIGDNHVRANQFDSFKKKGFTPINAIHPSSVIAKSATLGAGIVVLAGAIINAASLVGDNVIVNTAATIDHDNTIEDHAQIMPGTHLTGTVKVGSYSSVGSAAVVNPNITIGPNTIIGSGSVVTKDIPSNVVVYGVPAKVMETKRDKSMSKFIPITKPTLPPTERVISRFQSILASGMLTNHKNVSEFEKKVQSYLGVPHAIAMSSCTSGLIIVQKAYGLTGEVITPSFTFSATGHSIMWNNLTPVFADIDSKHYCLDPEKVKEAITDKTSAILAVHMFGHPADVDALREIADDHNLRLIFDAAHAFGSRLNGTHIGNFGDAEVFSCSPTKLMTTAEGGIVTTSDPELARKLRIGRNYGDDGSYDCEFTGVNARMSEFHAALGCETIGMTDQNVLRRNELVRIYKEKLAQLPGITFQEIKPGTTSTFKDFSLYINAEDFGMDRNMLCEKLAQHNIMAKKYFYPPLHEQRAYSHLHEKYKDMLPVTQDITNNVLSLPLFSHMSIEEVNQVIDAIKKISGGGA